MRTRIAIAAVAFTVVVVIIWSLFGNHSTTNSAVAKATLVPSVPAVSPSAALSILETHNLAHLENLPVQEIDDKTLFFTAQAPR
jgi:hypothetical protein